MNYGQIAMNEANEIKGALIGAATGSTIGGVYGALRAKRREKDVRRHLDAIGASDWDKEKYRKLAKEEMWRSVHSGMVGGAIGGSAGGATIARTVSQK